ncbi:MAG: radical SAM protein [Thermoprotei archaeon]
MSRKYRLDYAIWIFTGICNLDCIHCYAYRFRSLRELSLEEKLKLAHELGELGLEFVGLSGGEPLIHPHLPHILGVLQKYGIDKSLVTNATIVRDDILNTLYRTDTRVIVSIDGPREIHDAIRGKGVFDRVVANIKKIEKVLGSFSAVIAVNKLNYRVMDRVVETAIKLGADHISLIPVMPSGKALINKIYVETPEYIEALVKAREKASEYGVYINTWCTPWSSFIHGYTGTYSYCRTVSGFDIDPAGNLLLCDVIDLVITSTRGRKLTEALEEYYNHPYVKAVINPGKLSEPCKSCILSQTCKGGCYARSYNLGRELNSGDPLCPRVYAHTKYLKQAISRQ